MREHVTADVLSRLMHRELTDEEMIAALRHLDRCDDCAVLAQEQIERELADLPRALGLDSVEPEPHLDAETQILPYIDGRLDAADIEIAESHLDDCDECRAAVDAARSSGARFRRASLGYAVAAVAAAVAIVIGIAQIDRNPQAARTAVTIPVVVTNNGAVKPPAPPQEQPPAPRYAHPEWERLVSRAVNTGRLPFPDDLDELRGTEDTLRGDDVPAAEHVSPAGVVIDDARPELTWPAREGATYVVSIFEGENEVARSRTLRGTRWTPPHDLTRGRTYIWQVAAERAGGIEILPSPPAPQAMFRIVSERDHRELREAKAKHPENHMLLAVLYARSGMEKEAAAELEKSGRAAVFRNQSGSGQ